MVSEEDVSQIIREAKEARKFPCWQVLDSKCALSLKVGDGKSTYYFRLRRPKQISRSLGHVGEVSLLEAYQKALSMMVAFQEGSALPESKTRKCNLEQGQNSLSWLLTKWREHEIAKPFPRWSPTDRKASVKFNGIINNHLEPVFQFRRYDRISGEELAEFLTDLFRQHPSYAKSLLAWLESAYMWAERNGFCETGYQKAQRMKMLIKEARWRRQGAPRHHASLAVLDLPEFMAELREVGGTTARCLEIVILTCSRVASVTNMRWCDLDLQKGIWRCPKEDMKVSSNGDHIVYLSKQAIHILASMPRVLVGGVKAEMVFSTARGEKICNALTKVISSINLRRQKRGLPLWLDLEQSRIAGKDRVPTPHGFRATFKSWSRSDKLGNWRKYDSVAVERCLHHFTKDQYGGAYDREEFPLQQRVIWQDWADYCYSFKPIL